MESVLTPSPMSKKVLAYVRVSSKKQEDNDNSIPYQKRVISEYAQREGLQIIEWYEETHSAYTVAGPLHGSRGCRGREPMARADRSEPAPGFTVGPGDPLTGVSGGWECRGTVGRRSLFASGLLTEADAIARSWAAWDDA